MLVDNVVELFVFFEQLDLNYIGENYSGLWVKIVLDEVVVVDNVYQIEVICLVFCFGKDDLFVICGIVFQVGCDIILFQFGDIVCGLIFCCLVLWVVVVELDVILVKIVNLFDYFFLMELVLLVIVLVIEVQVLLILYFCEILFDVLVLLDNSVLGEVLYCRLICSGVIVIFFSIYDIMFDICFDLIVGFFV